MQLRTLIDHYFGGNRRAFQEAVRCSDKSVYRWLTDDAVVHQGSLYLTACRPVTVPDRRADFEAMMSRAHPDADLSRMDNHYVSERVEYAWTGWMLTQELPTREALG